MRDKLLISLLLIFISSGCAEQVVEIPFQKTELKNIRTVAILSPNERPELFMDVTADDHFLLFLFAGPAIISQLFITAAMHDAKKEDSRTFNELTFDIHVGRLLRDSFYKKLRRSAPFHILPPEKVEENKTVYRIQNKKEKSPEDYEHIAMELGADTVIELSVLACGVKDPGVFSKPHALLVAKAAMTRVRDNTVLWQTKAVTAIPQSKSFGFDYEKYEAEDAKVLKEELDSLAGILAESLVEDLGFKAHLPTERLLEPAGS